MFSALETGRVCRDTRAAVWGGALALFVVGDVLTTAVGLHALGAVEGHPGSAWVLETLGLGAMLLAKGLVLMAAVWLSRRVENQAVALGPALGLVLLGALVTAWNLAVLVALAAR